MNERFIALLYGLRRTGKTTLFYQLIRRLLDAGTDTVRICYYSFDDRSASLEGIIKLYEQNVLKKTFDEAGRCYLFLDEIQKVEGWHERIKIAYDLHPEVKFFLSGSASVSLRRQSGESLAGRMMDFRLKPLSFGEFAEWRGVESDPDRLELMAPRLVPLLMDYLRKGGFPEMVFEERDEAVRNYLKNAVWDRVIYRDLPEEFGLKDLELLRALAEGFAREPGMVVNVDNLSKNLGRSRVTVSNYIAYLRYGLLIREVGNLRPGFLVSSRKARKVYPASTAFCFALREDFYSDAVIQKAAEAAVADKLEAEHCYRDGFEVDFVVMRGGKPFPVEVKYGRAEGRQVRRFMEKFGAPRGLLISRDEAREAGGVRTVPLWRFLLERRPLDLVGGSPA